MQRGLSPNNQPDLTESKCLVLNGRHEAAIEKYFDHILADDRIAIDA